LTFAFAFSTFEGWPHIFGLIQIDSKFQIFRLGDGEN